MRIKKSNKLSPKGLQLEPEKPALTYIRNQKNRWLPKLIVVCLLMASARLASTALGPVFLKKNNAYTLSSTDPNSEPLEAELSREIRKNPILRDILLSSKIFLVPTRHQPSLDRRIHQALSRFLNPHTPKTNKYTVRATPFYPAVGNLNEVRNSDYFYVQFDIYDDQNINKLEEHTLKIKKTPLR